MLYELRNNIDSIAGEYARDGSEIPAEKRMGGAAGEDKRGPTRALIIASEVESCFCAGADLKERRTMSPDEYVLSPLSLAVSADVKFGC